MLERLNDMNQRPQSLSKMPDLTDIYKKLDGLEQMQTTINDHSNKLADLSDLMAIVKEHTTQLQDHTLRLDSHDKDIAELNARLKGLEDQLTALPKREPKTMYIPTGNDDSATVQLIKDFEARLGKAEFSIQDIYSTIKLFAQHSDISRIDLEIRKIYDLLKQKADSKDIEKLMQLINKLQKDCDELFKKSDTKLLIELQKKVQLIESLLANFKGGEDSKIGEGVIERLMKMLEAVDNKLNEFQEITKRKISEIEERLKDFLTHAEFDAFKDIIKVDIQNIIQQVCIKCASKVDLNKWVAFFQRELKKIYELLSGPSINTDDALLSRKPLGGISCASCDKNLINLQGKPADYYVWGKFPKPDKLPKGGCGFSKIISLMKDGSEEMLKPKEAFDKEEMKSQDFDNGIDAQPKLEKPHTSRPSTSQKHKTYLTNIKVKQ